MSMMKEINTRVMIFGGECHMYLISIGVPSADLFSGKGRGYSLGVLGARGQR